MQLMLMGLGLGLAAGVSPGPLLALVISSTLERGFGAGLRVALAPLITDLPIILIAVLLLREQSPARLAWLGIFGGCVVVYLGFETLLSGRRQNGGSSAVEDPRSTDLWRGALINLLNPHPWIFWATVQGPMLIRGWRQDPAIAIGFVFAFYLAIVGSKIAIAWLVARGRESLNDRWYRVLLDGSGLLLLGLGGLLIAQAVAAIAAAGT